MQNTLMTYLPTCSAVTIGLATSAAYPNLAADDLILAKSLSRYAHVVPVVWTGAEIPSLDACLVRSTWDSHLAPERFERWLHEIAGATRLFNSPRIIRWNMHKGYLCELSSAGVPVIPTRLYRQSSRPDLRRDMLQMNWERVVIKPAISASAYKTASFDLRSGEPKDAQRLLFEILEERDALVQPLQQEVFTIGERSAVYICGNFSHVVRRLPFGAITPNRREDDPPVRFSSSEQRFAEQVLSALPEPPLYARIDYVMPQGGSPLLMEVEMIDPSLFFQHHPPAADALADALRGELSGNRFTMKSAMRSAAGGSTLASTTTT